MDRSAKKKKRPAGNGARRRRAGFRHGLSIGALAFAVAVLSGGPVGAILQQVDVLTGIVVLILIIGLNIVADVIAVASTAADDVPFNAMASDRVPGAQEALIIVRNAGRVNSIFGDIVGDIAGTVSGVVATPVIFALQETYPRLPSVVLSALVIGSIAFLTIGGKALEKDFAVRQSTQVVLAVGKVIYLFRRLKRAVRRKEKRAAR